MKFFLKNRAVLLGILFVFMTSFAVLPAFVVAQSDGGDTSVISGNKNTSVTSLKNPLGEKNSDLKTLIDNVIQIFLDFFAIVAVIYLVYGGFLFIKAQGNPEALNDAKTNIMWAIIGLAVILGAKAVSTIITNTIKSLT